jgi:hypothetical protein
MEQETTDDGKLTGLAIVYYALGRREESDAALTRLVKEHADIEAFDIAEVFAFRGQSVEAMPIGSNVRMLKRTPPCISSNLIHHSGISKRIRASRRFSRR